MNSGEIELKEEVVGLDTNPETDSGETNILKAVAVSNQKIDVSGDTKIIEIEKGFGEALDNVGVTDEKQAEVLLEIMTKANKLIPTKDEGIMYVPDWTARLGALKLSLQAKGHLSPKEKKNDSFDGKIFVFSKS